MSFLVRKIHRPFWSGSDAEGSRIKADVVARCIQPKFSQISVWFAEDETTLERAKIATLTSLDKPATVDLVVLSVEEVEAAGLKIVANPAAKGPATLKPLHRDIDDLDVVDMRTVAQLVQQQVIANRVIRISEKACKQLVEKAIRENVFPVAELSPEYAAKLDLRAAAL